MSSKLAELFRASGGAPVLLAGGLVHMMYEVTGLVDAHGLRIEFLQPSPARPQALRLKARDGFIELNGQLLDDVVLWSDSAPESVVARFHPRGSEKSMSLRIWNAWRDDAGAMQSWIGNAGILIDELPNKITVLKCSDGFDGPTFDDLVARLELIQVGAPQRQDA